MEKLLTKALLAVLALLTIEAGARPKRPVTVNARVSVHVPVKRIVVKKYRPVRTVRVVKRVVPVRPVRVIKRVVPVRRVCCSRPRLNVGFGFGGPRCGFSFGVGF